MHSMCAFTSEISKNIGRYFGDQYTFSLRKNRITPLMEGSSPSRPVNWDVLLLELLNMSLLH